MQSNEDLLQIKLSGDPLMSTALRSNYDCSVIHDALRGLLLSPRGAHQTGPNPDDCYLTLCAGCRKAICKKGKTTPPKLAIVNGFAIGSLPTRFTDAQRAEILLVKMVRPQGWICYGKAKVENGIKGHSHAVEIDVNDVAKVLPRTYPFSVILTGNCRDRQKLAMQRPYSVRGKLVFDLLDFFIQNNTEYKHIKIDGNFPLNPNSAEDVMLPGATYIEDDKDVDDIT